MCGEDYTYRKLLFLTQVSLLFANLGGQSGVGLFYCTSQLPRDHRVVERYVCV